MKLVIVESPTKVKTVAKYLGKDYKVLASYGHVRDLAKNGKYNLGVDIDSGNFEVVYEVDAKKARTISAIKKAASQAELIYLATDPDREGEAISWHLSQVIEVDPSIQTKRLEFNEITPYGIKNALEKPRDIDMDIVASQETRRVIDRIIGFRLSYLMNEKIHSKSAGRVQSVVLKILADKEEEINAFIPEDYYEIFANIVNDSNQTVKAKLVKKDGKAIKISTLEDAESILEDIGGTLTVNISEESKNVYPRPPLTTSALQQEANIKYRFSSSKTMQVAQSLYEGVSINKSLMGLITYMRTDSIRFSPQFINQAKKFIEETFGKEYVGRAYAPKGGANVQDAHEAIRPTDINLTPQSIKEFLTPDQYKLYSLIYSRALASIMTAEEVKVTTGKFLSNGYEFEADSEEILFEGFTRINEIIESKSSEIKKTLIDFVNGNDVKVKKYDTKKNTTKAPSRFSEGSLVKKMEETGIGRPSTYASTIETLKKRGYVSVKSSALIPSEQGLLTAKELEKFFSKTINIKYTAELEKFLDTISEGNADKLTILRQLNEEFEQEFKVALTGMEKVQFITTGEECPRCGKPLVHRHGKYGDFIGCSGYPECNYIKPNIPEVPKNAKVCPKCGQGHLVVRNSKKGPFLACNRYPDCSYTTSFKKSK